MSGDWTAGAVAGSIMYSAATNDVFVIDITVPVIAGGILFPSLDNSFLAMLVLCLVWFSDI